MHPALAGGTTVTISDTAPGAPSTGAMWFDSVGTQMYLFYNDGNRAQWVPTTNQVTGIQEAPSGGVLYGRRNSAWASVDAAIVPAQNNTGRNLLHNPLFNVTQRGAGPWNSSGVYTVDRWQIAFTGDTMSSAVAAAADADRAAAGDETMQRMLSVTASGTAGAGAYSLLMQPIEGVRRLAGKTVTVSFWAVASAAGRRLGVSCNQVFGTGGSPSAGTSGTGQSVALTTSLARYSVTLTIPSSAGKVLGTNGDDSTQLFIWYSASSTFNVNSGTVGVQTITANLWGVQLEIGSVATPLEKPDPQQDLAKCQRFYQTISIVSGGYATSTGQINSASAMPQVFMRAAPAITPISNSNTNMGALTYAVFGASIQAYGYPVTAGGGYGIAVNLALSADL
ncbi:MAG TPA: hypothetical protein VGH84_00650 [Steroidobacteraceae bacterium]